jgi:hypothetical protein
VKVPPAAMAPAWLTATELPHGPGRATGDDHEAASAGSAGETPTRPGPPALPGSLDPSTVLNLRAIEHAA